MRQCVSMLARELVESGTQVFRIYAYGSFCFPLLRWEFIFTTMAPVVSHSKVHWEKEWAFTCSRMNEFLLRNREQGEAWCISHLRHKATTGLGLQDCPSEKQPLIITLPYLCSLPPKAILPAMCIWRKWILQPGFSHRLKQVKLTLRRLVCPIPVFSLVHCSCVILWPWTDFCSKGSTWSRRLRIQTRSQGAQVD